MSRLALLARRRPGAGAPAALGTPALAAIATAAGGNLGGDGITWPSADPLLVDKHGNLVLLLGQAGGGGVTFAYSNDGGATWADGLNSGFITRGSLAYDAARDTIHVLWRATDPGDGMIYRRYAIGYSGNAITGLARDTAVNLQLDFGAIVYEAPSIALVAGTLVCTWAAYTGDGSATELRASARVLSYAAADNTAGNWVAPAGASADTLGVAPAVAYTALDAASAGSNLGQPGHTLLALAGGDLALASFHGDRTTGVWRYRRLTRTGAATWTAGGPATIGTVQRAGANTGYAQKFALASKLVDCGGGTLAVALPTWKDDTAGDTWSWCPIVADVPGALTDVYSAGGAHSYAPVGDLSYDATSGKLVVSYLKTTTVRPYARAYPLAGGSPDAEIAIGAGTGDIPCLGRDTRYGAAGVATVAFRDQAGSPYTGYFGTIPWE